MSQPLDGKTADEALEIINTKMTAEKALKVTMDMDISLDMPNIMDLTVDMKGTTAMKQTEDTLLADALMNMSMSMEGALIGSQSTNATSTMKYDGTTLYMTSAEGEEVTGKMKATADRDALLAAMNSSGSNPTVNIDWNDWTAMKNAAIEKKDGKYILTASEVSDAFRDAILGATDSLGALGGELEVTAVSVTMTCSPDGFCEKIVIGMDITLSVQGMDATMRLDATADYEKLASDFAVSAPADAADYEEVDLDVLFPSIEDAE
jgi:hypothetical protein